MSLTKGEIARFEQLIQINTNTIIQMMQGIKVKESEKASPKAQIIMLGCIALALTARLELEVALAPKSFILTN